MPENGHTFLHKSLNFSVLAPRPKTISFLYICIYETYSYPIPDGITFP